MSGQYAELVARLEKGAVDLCGEGCCYSAEMREAASALTTLTQKLKQHEDMAVPIVNGGALTTASGTAFDTICTDFATCPYCGFADQDSWEIGHGDEGETETCCNSCGEAMLVCRDIFVSYTTMKVDRTAPETSTRSADE